MSKKFQSKDHIMVMCVMFPYRAGRYPNNANFVCFEKTRMVHLVQGFGAVVLTILVWITEGTISNSRVVLDSAILDHITMYKQCL